MMDHKMMIDPAQLIHICDKTPVFQTYDAGRVDVQDAVDACEHVACVPLSQYREVQDRLRHLLQSDVISSYDAREKGEYKRKITDADRVMTCPGHWIKVSDRLPPAGERVLMQMDHGFVGEGWLGKDDGRWYRYQSMLPVEMMLDQKVLAWMPMPTAE